MSYHTGRTWTTGDLVAAAALNRDIRDNWRAIAHPELIRMQRGGANDNQSIQPGVVTPVLWKSSLADYDYNVDAVGRFYAPRESVYLSAVAARWASSAGTSALVWSMFNFNNGTYPASRTEYPPPNVPWYFSDSLIIAMTPEQTLHVDCYQVDSLNAPRNFLWDSVWSVVELGYL